jgi:hypothetical protein
MFAQYKFYSGEFFTASQSRIRIIHLNLVLMIYSVTQKEQYEYLFGQIMYEMGFKNNISNPWPNPRIIGTSTEYKFKLHKICELTS